MSTAERNLLCLQSIVNEQAKDVGLWCMAITPPEEHLQEALVRLHEAIRMVQPKEPDA